ncbi:MAG: hypothetical protein JWR72_3073 [Flavisolibacter sp.]|jgi:hypothetical protein|nr:hypothetical protein [Flavisolibacter sp.]
MAGLRQIYTIDLYLHEVLKGICRLYIKTPKNFLLLSFPCLPAGIFVIKMHGLSSCNIKESINELKRQALKK